MRGRGDADVAVVVVGQDERETEGLDATTMDLPDRPGRRSSGEVAAVNPRTVVVVNTASPVTMDWADDVAAIVQLSYLGQETGRRARRRAVRRCRRLGPPDDHLSPCGSRTAPAHANFPGQDGTVTYAEGIFVGYRHYDTKGVEPAGASATACRTRRSPTRRSPSRRTGRRRRRRGRAWCRSTSRTRASAPGSEVVQVYVRQLDGVDSRPDRELKAFEKVTLDPGETATVTVALDERAFAYWDAARHDWHVAAGDYEILVGSSSRAIHRTATWTVRRDVDRHRRADQRKRVGVGGEAVAEVVDVEADVGGAVVDATEPAALVAVEVGRASRPRPRR